MTLSGALLLTFSMLATAGTPAPFDGATMAPADVSLYVRVTDARTLHATLARRPVLRGVTARLAGGELGTAWTGLARALESDGDELFDAWFGEDCTLLLRERPGAGADWAVVTRIDAGAARTAVGRLTPRRLAPRHGVPMVELPEHGLVVATTGARAVVGPPGPGGLLDDVLARLAAVPGLPPALADEPGLARARALAPGRIEVFTRFGSPLDGWSALTIDVDGDSVTVAHDGRFRNPPFTRPIPTRAWDMAPLDAFEDGALLALLEPTEIGAGAIETFLEASLGTPLLGKGVRDAIGARRIIALGEVEGRLEAPPVDLLVPAGAVAFELDRNTAEVRAAFDAHLVHLAGTLRGLGQGSYLVEVPTAHALPSDVPRQADVGPALSARTGGFPVMRTVSLNWAVTEGPFGSYCVIATHPEQLDATARALRGDRRVTSRSGTWATCGTLDGRRLARHLRSYRERPALLLPAEADPMVLEDFRFTLGLFADLVDGVERCRWQVARPTEHDVRLDATMVLSEAPSADCE